MTATGASRRVARTRLWRLFRGGLAMVALLAAGMGLMRPLTAGQLHHDHHTLASQTVLGLNWWSSADHRPPLGWFWVDFLLFVGLLIFAAKRPLERAFSDRHDHIRRAIAEAAAAHAKATGSQQETRRLLGNLDAEVSEMERQNRLDGEAERDQIVRDAIERVASFQKEGDIQQQQEEARTLLRLQKQALTAIFAVAESRLASELTEQDQQRLLASALEEINHLPLQAATTQAKPS